MLSVSTGESGHQERLSGNSIQQGFHTQSIQQERNKNMSAGRVLVGVVIGMATGAVLGVLFAPDKGSNTRDKLSQTGSRYMRNLKGTASKSVDTLKEKFEGVKEAAGDLTGKVKGTVDSLGGNMRRA
jgi:gas vesicle protein